MARELKLTERVVAQVEPAMYKTLMDYSVEKKISFGESVRKAISNGIDKLEVGIVTSQ